jgi:hypothetical protein
MNPYDGRMTPRDWMLAAKGLKTMIRVEDQNRRFTCERCEGARREFQYFRWKIKLRCKRKTVLRTLMGDILCAECLFKAGATIIENNYLLVSKTVIFDTSLGGEESPVSYYGSNPYAQFHHAIPMHDFGAVEIFLMEIPCDLKFGIEKQPSIRLGKIYMGLDKAENDEQVIEMIKLAREKIHLGEWEAEKALHALNQAAKARQENRS